MAPSSQFYSFLVSFLSVLLFSTVQADVTHQTNFRCTKICKDESARVAQSHQVDCQRGCRYYNIEFLTAATDEGDSVVDSSSKTELQSVLEQCKILCQDAYPKDGMRRDACDLGCRKMHEIQLKAPVASAPGLGDSGSFVVYMGAGEQSMVVVPDLSERTGWVLLNSLFRPMNDYNDVAAAAAASSSSASYRLTETRVQTMPIAGGASEKHRFGEYRRNHSPFCIPAWLWLIPVMLLVALVYIQYNGNNMKNVLLFEEESSDEEQEILQVERVKEEGSGLNVTIKDKDTFLIAFQPMDFVEAKLQDLPPKYDEQRN